MRPEHIILHHSLTEDGETVSWGAIRRYHVYENSWRDIGYHLGIELANDRYEIFTGRMMNEYGAHCSQDQMNTKSIGICFVGNFDFIKPPEPQWDLGIKLVKSLLNIFDIPRQRVWGHSTFNHIKTCPGRLFDIGRFKEGLK